MSELKAGGRQGTGCEKELVRVKLVSEAGRWLIGRLKAELEDLNVSEVREGGRSLMG